METSREDATASRPELDRTDKYASAVAKTIPSQDLLKTTPRSARPQIEAAGSKRKSFLVPRLPIGSKVTPPMKPSSSKVQINSSSQKHNAQNVSGSINESQIFPPPLLLNDQDCEWDSNLDETKVEIDEGHLKQLQADFREQAILIDGQSDLILFKQLFALQNGISTALLDIYRDTKPSHQPTKAQVFTHDNKENRQPASLLNQYQRQSSKIGAKPLQNHSLTRNSRMVPQVPPVRSTEKNSQLTDVKLSQILNVTNDIVLQSPLEEISMVEGLRRQGRDCANRIDIQDRDVKMEEVLNAPSLSISLKTVTEASAILKDGYSFLKSEVKQPRPE